MADLEQLKLEFEREKHADEMRLAGDRFEVERLQAGRFSGGAVTLIGALIAVVSAILTTSIDGFFGSQTTSENNATQLRIKEKEVDGQLLIKEKEVDGQISVQNLIAKAERDRLEIQQKFDIIVQATKGLPREEASDNLVFYVEAGILQDTDDGKILALAKEGKAPTTPTENAPVARNNPLLQRVAEHCAEDASESENIVVAGGVICGGAGLVVNHIPTPNFDRNNKSKYLIIGYSAGESVASSVNILTDSGINASTHIIIGREGRVTQLLPFDLQAWHAGGSSWGSLKRMNRHSIGIQMINWGRLRVGGSGSWVSAAGEAIPVENVVVAVARGGSLFVGWEKFDIAQIEVLKKIAMAIKDSDPEIIDVLGKNDVSHKASPGPAFPMEEVRQAVFGRTEALPPP